ncbi:unnamed protein product [Amoebophrya sp. A25]|nr:unnamed protein product [Amoebophrya sp. A25]|eukprot:GSA25T00027852001.1
MLRNFLGIAYIEIRADAARYGERVFTEAAGPIFRTLQQLPQVIFCWKQSDTVASLVALLPRTLRRRFRWSPFCDFSFREVKDICLGRSPDIEMKHCYFFPDAILFLLCQYVQFCYCDDSNWEAFFFRTLWWFLCSIIFLLPLLLNDDSEMDAIHIAFVDGVRIFWGPVA